MKKVARYCLYICTAMFFATTGICQTAHIEDYAQVLSPEITTRLEKLLDEIEAKKGLYIEEIILFEKGGKSLESIEKTFVERLEQNPTQTDKRVLLLIVMEDKFVKLYASGNLQNIYNQKNSNDIIANVKLRMAERRYDEMARIGVAGIYHYYQESLPKEKKNYLYNILFFTIAIIAVLVIGKFLPKKPTW